MCEDGGLILGEERFMDHVKSHHPELKSELSEDSHRGAFIAEAAKIARQKIQRKPAPDAPSEISRRSSTDSMKLNIGDAGSLSALSRPISAVGTKQTEQKIENFERLSIANRPDQAKDPPPGATGVNPLKRSANQSGSLEPKAQEESQGSPKNRRVKGHSNESNENEASIGRDPGAEEEKQSLDPHSDAIASGRTRTVSQAQRSVKKATTHAKDTESKIVAHNPHLDFVNNPHIGVASHVVGNDNFSRVDINLEQLEPTDDWEDDPELLLQPETRPISHEQLVHEVKGIYAGLVMVEAKCIDVDSKQSIAAQERDPNKRTQLSPEQWSALIALHKTLLHEHHDFFLASQHPSASPALTKLAEKYSMPARMWKHGIHAFLEVLRLRLPGSLDHMLAFIYIAYSMMALLYETVPSFEDTWIECLGDLGRYRMAIGDEDVKDRDVWSGVARFWYGKAADKNPQIGRLHHHLAILARSYTIQQLSLYTRSLTAVVIFEGAKTSIMTLFNPAFNGQQVAQFKPNSLEGTLTRCLAFLYTGRTGEEYNTCIHQMINLGLLSRYIERVGGRFREIGVFICLSVLGALLEFGSSRPKGSSRSLIRRAFEDLKRSRQMRNEQTSEPAIQSYFTLREELTVHEIEVSKGNIVQASKLVFSIMAVALRRPQDKNLQPMVHAYLAFIRNLAPSDSAMQLLEHEVPWSMIVTYLNHHASLSPVTAQITSEEFPKPADGVIGRPLPEDFLLRGQVFAEDYFPSTWFSDADIDDEERVLELPSMTAPRIERILWNGYSISRHQKWIVFDSTSKRFEETAFAKRLPGSNLPITVDPSIASMEAETLISEPLEDEKASFEVSESPPKESKSDFYTTEQEPRSPREVFMKKTPTILKREEKGDLDMIDASFVKKEKVELTNPTERPDHIQWDNRKPKEAKEVPAFPNVKQFAHAKESSEGIRIFDGTEPTET